METKEAISGTRILKLPFRYAHFNQSGKARARLLPLLFQLRYSMKLHALTDIAFREFFLHSFTL